MELGRCTVCDEDGRPMAVWLVVRGCEGVSFGSLEQSIAIVSRSMCVDVLYLVAYAGLRSHCTHTYER